MRYREWQPGPELTDWVKCAWTLDGGESTPLLRTAQPVIPDGCIEVVFHLADPFVRCIDEVELRQPSALVVGQTTGPTFVRPSGRVRAFGIRLLPWGGTALFRRPVSELTDEYLPLDDLLPALAGLGSELAAGPESEWPRMAFSRLSKCFSSAGRFGTRSKMARLIVQEHGRITVRGLAENFGCTARTVERIIKTEVGLPPLLFARIVRMQEALGRVNRSSRGQLGDLAIQTGFYDQAHFCRDFKRLTSLTPTQFRAERREITRAFSSCHVDRPSTT